MIKILIELPSWLGDTVMATPAIENILNQFNDVDLTLIGSFRSIEVLKNHQSVNKSFVLDKDLVALYKTINLLESFEIFISFRSSYRSKLLKFLISSKYKYQFNKNIYSDGHQVEKYNNFINDSLSIKTFASSLNLNIKHKHKHKQSKKKKILGINPGASYGSAKQWYPSEFAAVSKRLSSHYDTIIFGGPKEKDIALDIEKHLIDNGINNYQNTAGELTIEDLVSEISKLDLFVTGDSGPMHIAACFEIPTVAIFGPTSDKETSQWMNTKSVIVKKNLACQPCMQRECPLNHHDCMKQIKSDEVLEAIKKITK